MKKKTDKDLANFFNIYSNDEDGSRYFNMTRSVYFDGNAEAYPFTYNKYIAKEGDAWTTISYKFYNTIEYWWIICKFNSVIDPTVMPIAGELLKIPTLELANKVKKEIR